MKRRLLASLLTLVMMLSLLPTAVWATDTGSGDPQEAEDTAEPAPQRGEGETPTPVNAADGKLDLDNGSIVISATGYTQGDEETEIGYESAYIISQTSEESTTNNITVTGGTHTIMLNGVNVDVSSQTGEAACAFAIKGNSDVTLVLADGTTNSFTSGSSVTSLEGVIPKDGKQYIGDTPEWKNCTSYAGIAVNAGTSLTIEGQGRLEAYADVKNVIGADAACAAIGANGTPSGNKWSTNADGCGDITINSGTVIAYNTYSGAGIGGGKDAATVTINGGVVEATGSTYGCGIGSCYQNTGAITIEINDGEVTATARGNAAGIGGPIYRDNYCPVTINGGKVTANGGGTGAGIGSGGSGASGTPGNGGNITITGGEVIATGGEVTVAGVKSGGAGIGGGCASSSSNTTGAGMGNIVITGGTVIATGGNGAPGIGTASNAADAANVKDYAIGSLKISGANVKAVAGDGYNTENDYAVAVLKSDTACGIGLGKNAPESVAAKFADWDIDIGGGAPMEVVTLTNQSDTVAITRNGGTWHSFTANESGEIVLYCAEGYYKYDGGNFLVASADDKAAAETLKDDLNRVGENPTQDKVAALDVRYAAMSAAQQSYVKDNVESGNTIEALKEAFKGQETSVTFSCENDKLNGTTDEVKYESGSYKFAVPTYAPANYVFDGWFARDVRVTDANGDGEDWPYLGDTTVTAHWRSEITGTGTESDPYVILHGSNMVALSHISNDVGTPEELALFSGALSKEDLLSKNFVLGADITLKNGKDVLDADRYYSIVGFTGMFDGKGKSENGYKITLSIDTSELAEKEGTNNGKVNIALEGMEAKYLEIIGGVFTSVKGATLKNIVTDGSVKLLISGGSVGTLVGSTRGNVTFENCINNADLTEGSTSNTNWAAGLVGQVENGTNSSTTTFIDCVNNGDVTAGVVGTSLGNSCAAGIASLIFTKNLVFENCSNTGTLIAKRATDVAERYSSAAGIAGLCYTNCDTLVMENCTNSGKVWADAERENTAYGLAGVSGSMSAVTLTNCSNSGEVLATGGTAYVLIGGRGLDSVSMPKSVTYSGCAQILSAEGNHTEYSFGSTKAAYADGKTTLSVPVEKNSDNSFDAERYVEKDGAKAADLVSMDNSEVYNDFSHNANAVSNELPFSSWDTAYSMRTAADYVNFVKAIRGDAAAQNRILGSKLYGASTAVKSAALAKAYIKLTGSFTLSDVSALGLGTPSELFTGHVDGNGYTVTYDINAVDLNDNISANVGFIGCADQAEIRNINFEGSIAVTTSAELNSNLYVGAAVARGSNMTIDNCKVETSIEATLTAGERKNDTAGVAYVGGIGGSLMDSTVTNSSFTGSAQATAWRQTRLGGIAGNFHGTISDCEVVSSKISGIIDANPAQYLTGTAANAYVGGAIGYGAGTVQNTTVCAVVSADSHLMSGLDNESYKGIKRNAYVGGLIGWNDNGIAVKDSKSLTTVAATVDNGSKNANPFVGSSASGKTLTLFGTNWYVKTADTAEVSGATAIDTTVLDGNTFGETVEMEVPAGVTMSSKYASLDDSTVSFIKATAEGETGTVKLVYGGQTFFTTEISVAQKPLSNGDVIITGINDKYPSHEAAEAAKDGISIIYGGKKLAEEDYTVSRENGKFTITFKGNYSGSVTRTYDVVENGLPTVTVSDATFAYDGQNHTIVVNNPNNDDVKFSMSPSGYGAQIEKKDAGTYVIYWQAAKDGRTVSGSATLVINKAKLTIKADDQFMYVGGTVPTPTFTATGLVKGETLTHVDLACKADGKTVGKFDIIPSNADTSSSNDNYEITYVNGTLTVSRRHSSPSATTPEPTPDDSTSFVDVPANAYFADAVEWAVENGVTNGLTDTMFGPYESCTRAQIVTFLWRAAGSPEPKAMGSFTDVPASAYYAKAVAWAVENGITNGMTETTFAPDATCTRGQSVTFLYRALKGTASGSANFTDVPANAFYADAVNWAVANNVTNGTSATTFSPNADCTRAEIVTFLYRAYQGK